MLTPAMPHQTRRPFRPAFLALVAILVLAVAGGAAATSTKRVAKAQETSDGGSVLANLRGHTLYSLSVEKHGKFICTGGCLSVWHPLVVPGDIKPTGPVPLGTVERPDGRTQATYKGRPLYSFDEDAKGETNGEGVKDVGTWHAATLQAAPPPVDPEPTPPSPYPTTTPPSQSPPQSPPAEPPYQSPPYNY